MIVKSATKGMTNIHLEGNSKKLSKLSFKKNVNNKMHKKFKKINLATDENNLENANFSFLKNSKPTNPLEPNEINGIKIDT